MIKPLDFSLVKKRINTKPRASIRFPTKLPDFDEFIGGGLPNGITLIWGHSGSGKSKLARTIAKAFASQKKKVFYFFGEDSGDAPLAPPFLNTVDMVSWKMGPAKAAATILSVVQHEKPDLIVLDSLTAIYAKTTTAVSESDIRDYTAILSDELSGKLPIIAVSASRGEAAYEKPAGGQGVKNPAILVIKTKKILISDDFAERNFGREIGEMFWTIMVEKDRDGVAVQNKLKEISYFGENIILNELGGN